MTRVLHVITRLIVGGAQENTVLSCRGLAELGYDIELLAGPETGPEGSLFEEAARHGFRVDVIDPLRRDPDPMRDAAAVGLLTRHFLRARPDIVHTHSSKAGILGRLAAFAAGVPVIIHTNHGMPFHDRQKPVVQWAWRGCEMVVGPATDHIVCVGETLRRDSVRARLAREDRHSVIYSGMETEGFVYPPEGGDLRAAHGIPRQAEVIGALGRLSPQKGPDDFLRVAERVLNERPGAFVLWVGDGPERVRLQAAADRMPAGARIRFVGRVAPSAVPVHLSAMDVLVHTSFWEGLPRVVVQAGLAGRPAVAYDASGVDEVILEGVTGHVVPAGQVGEAVDRVHRVLDQPDRGRAMGEEARRRLKDRFDWRRMVEALDALYKRLLARRRRRVEP